MILKTDSQLAKMKSEISPAIREQLSKHRGKIMKVSETEYIPIAALNSQDQEDVRNIKSLESVAKERSKQKVECDEQYLLEDHRFLFEGEIV